MRLSNTQIFFGLLDDIFVYIYRRIAQGICIPWVYSSNYVLLALYECNMLAIFVNQGIWLLN